MQPGVQKLEWSSTVVLDGERVEFQFYVDVPEPSSKFLDLDVDYLMMFSLWSTSARIETEFFQMATTNKTRYNPLIREFVPEDGRILQLENYEKTAMKVVDYLRRTL